MKDRLLSLAALLCRRAEESPDRGYTWLAQGEEAADRLTYAGLEARARTIAAALAGAVLPGERALLLYPPGLEFIASFFGCLYAGVIAVPAYPPHSRRPDPRLASIATDCRPRVVLTTAALLARREALAAQVPELAGAFWLDTEEPSPPDPLSHPPSLPPGRGGNIAFLQYTSGSTGSPKGVIVTHANLLDNLERIRIAFGQTPESVVVGWLPLFHDMGLIGNVLQPCFVGADCVLMSPAAFLQKPARWLQAIHRFHGTTSGGPNFAYDLCTRSVGPEVRAGLDLSSWSVAFNGAEPVRAETLRRFAEAFTPCGFRRAAFVPCYGLAEATLLVTAARGADDDSPVSCGALPSGGEVLVVDPEAGAPSVGEAVGEIWVSGPSVAAGYWNRPEETRETFGAVLQDGRGPHLRYLRTGDLGFVRGGELVVTGRLKDLIILRGRNLYPQDVELTAEQAHPALRAGGGAAFSVEEQGEERLVVVFEVGREAGRHPGELSTIADAIRRAVAEEHGVRVAGVALLRPGTVPKTSSGKIRRHECRARYLDGGLEVLHRSGERTEASERLLTRVDLLDLDPVERAAALTAWLCKEIARRAGVAAERIGPEMVIAAAGLDSLALFDLQGRLEADLGLPPRGASLTDLSVAGLRDLLLDQLAEPETTDLPPLARGEILGEHPLSPGQEALWFLEQSLPVEGVFHIAAAARLGTAVDSAALLRAALVLVDRHPALRTTFGETGGEPRQRVHVYLAPDLAEVDAAAWSSGELDDALRREARRRFDLGDLKGGAGSPLRLRIFHRPGGERILLLVLHHLVGDFWSLAVLLRDWAALYGGQDGGRLLPVLPAAYTDFVRQQRRLLAGPAGERLERFWLDRLRGAPLALDLPTDRPRPPVATHAGARLDLRLDPNLTGRLRELGGGAGRQGATLFTTLVAGFQILLGRLTGQEGFLLGAPTTGRRDRDLDGVVGYFVNPVVLRADLTDDPPFGAFLARTRQTVSEALEHRDLPFAQLARLLQPVRDASRPPVVQAFLVLQQNAAASTGMQEPGLAAFAVGQAGACLEIGGLALESIHLEPGTAQLDLTLFAAAIEDAVVLSCEHDSALFDGVTIRRWLGHLQALLEAAAEHPERRLGELPWLTGAERQQLLREWNDTAPAVPREAACLHELFAAQVRRTPDAVAVIDGRREILYRELAAAAGRLAARLRGRGAGPEVVAGVCLERSAEMVVALLALLEAGAAWLPLDPRLPRRRLEGMLTGARAALVVSSGKLAAGLPWNGKVVLVDEGEVEEEAVEEGEASRWGRSDPASLAYVLFTSGSTGEPKGVAVTHRGAVELVRWAGAVYAPEELAGVLAATALSFDLSVFELFVPLSHGGTVILAENVLELPALPSAGRVTLVNTVPSAMAELVHAGSLGASVRTVNLAGEPLPRALAGRLYATGTVERVWNLYGPSEDTTYSTFARVARDGPEPPRIGRPVTATRAHVLAGGLDPVPAGIPGELYLGGAGLARGYLHRPGLTAERFLPDPFAEAPGARLYRTGDRVRWTAAGELEFLGRFDHQVKIRGFRIEPEEIEAVLVALPGVREAVVVAREDTPGDRHLVAYVAGDGMVGELRQGLRERLPEHMVPAVFVALPALPLTPNGKVDRKALPAPEQQGAAERSVVPRTPVEEVVAGIWTELLGVSAGQRIGADSHFFDLGGHSLLATRVTSRLRTAFGVEMPLRTLFEAPVLADLAARVEAARRSGAVPTPPLIPVPREGPLPLSFAQQRLWLIDQLEPGSPLYNMPGALRIEGPLGSRVLSLCLGEIVRRHEALRTVFAVLEGLDGVPVQVIRPAAPFVLPVVDLSGLPEPTQEATAATLLAEEAVRPFDLARGPLLRGVLLRFAEEDHVLALTLHHIVSDGWSLGILVRELTALYPELAAGRPSPLPELPVQFADFAVWQHSWLHSELLESEISFWRRQLAGLPPLLDLPVDRPRPAVQSYRGRSRPVRLPAGLTRQAEVLARREGATLFMVLLAAFQVLLARLSGQDDLAVGSPVAGRNRVETEGLIGFFVNTLVLRGDLSGAPTFRALLGRTRETALAAWLHQDVPFERLVEDLAPERSLAQPPLFQVMFVLQNVPVESLEIESLGLRPVDVEAVSATGAKFDLTLNLAEHGGALAGTVEYATALFDAATIGRLTGCFERLLAAAVATPELPVMELPLLSAAERHQLLREWSDTAAVFPREATLHGLFAAQAKLSPDAVAVEQGGERLTYGELLRWSGRIARRLVARGLRPEERVAVLGERSPDLIAALLGILQAGGAYLPLDSASPAQRLHWMLRDAGATLLMDLLDSEEPAAGPPLPALPKIPAESLACVMYTSGSTGTPKGVAVTHRNVIRLVRGGGYADLGPEQTWLQYAPVSFDASTLEIWAPLLNGGRLVLFPGRIGSLDELAGVVETQGVTSAWLTAGLFHEMVDGCLAGLRPLSQLLAGGDVVSPVHARRVLEAHPGLTLIDGYGPTEGTTFTCCHRMTEGVQVGAVVPIGRPIANARVRVLDERLAPVPIGVWGELYAGGDGLARGYLGRPDLTAERFVPDAFGESGGRLYRTGDRVRHRADGLLEFFGRLDDQVKIRGFRIEPGEIEAALVALAGVREAVVVARQDRKREIRLVAYVVGEVAAEELRASLRERLPDSMVPAAFVTLPALPLTANGKVDRKALPAPERPAATANPLAPRTPVEEILAGIWSELLEVERIGVTGHFFELGGHSLLATQAVSRLRGAFGVELPVRDLFEAPVLADLAVRVEAALCSSSAPAPPLVPVPREGPLPLSFAQQRLWFIDRLAPGNPLYNVPVALRVEGPLRPAVLARCLGEIVRRHEALRTVFIARDGAPMQVIQPAVQFVLPVVDLSGLAEKEREAAALALAGEEAGRPFDLARDSMLRGLLVRLEAGDHVAALTMHHIASDGWSMGVLVREAAALYAMLAEEGEDRPSPLPPLPVQYADFSAWQASWLRGEMLDSEIAFWRRQLAGLPPLLELPTDRPRPAVQSFRGTSRPLRLPAGLARQAEELARREGATLFMVLLAVFQTFLARTSGRRDLAVGSPIAGRNRLEIEGLIGFFVNTLVLRGDLSGERAGEPTFRELLGRVRETALAAWLHQDVPFEKLVEELAPERSLAHAPLFQVMLALQNAPAGSLEIERLRLRPVHVEGTTAKFDLTVSFAAEAVGMGGLTGFAEHASDLFDAATVDRWLGHFERLLAAALTRSGEPVFELPLLGEAERFQLLVEWNDTAPPPPPTTAPLASVWELFAAQARRAPDAVAVVCGGVEVTYAELAGRAGRLALCLRRRGVGPDVLVGLFAERSLDMIAGVLGIFQSGGACVPLDIRHPAQRLAFLLDDTRAPVVLTQAHLRDRLPAAGGAEILLLDGDGGDGGAAVGAGPAADNLAYVVFTSGSTGQPKGVALSHGALRNVIDWHLAALLGGVRTLQFALLSFDVSFYEMFVCWASGGTLVLVPDESRRDMPALAGLLVEQRIEKAILPVVVLQQLAELFAGRRDLPPLREITTTGERLQTSRAMAALFRRLPGCAFHNHYGPSETHVATAYTLPSDPRGWSAEPPIGRPIRGASAYVLTPGLLPAPVGVPGDLHLGGASLARCYLGRPGLTAERFVPDPFGGAPGSRLYRTGDKVRLLANGDLEYLGRLDDQVKIRGFRIEPGEIEAALVALPGVREAVVVARESAPGNLRLIAYVVGDRAPEELRRELRERLPEHMVPAVFVRLAALPTTPNGKVDRKALPVPQSPVAEAAGLEPRTPVEKTLAGIWCEVLEVPRVGFEENFFDLGGHSLLLPKVQARVRDRIGREVSLVELLTHTTVRALASHLAPEEMVPATSVMSVMSVPWAAAVRGAGDGAIATAIAVIGLAGRFPGAAGVEQLWTNLCAGVSSIARFSDEELAAAGVDPALFRDPRYVPAAGALDGVELFDAGFFGYSPREAEILDPQQRVFLECAWEALENAGYDSARTPGPVGVFAGLGFNLYLHQLLAGLDRSTVGDLQLLMGNDKDFLSTRASYKLDLKGPSMAVQTACSSSLVAVHLACQNLLLGACDMALAGGVSISLPQRAGYLYQEGGILSPDGCCRAFDAEARGSVPASGAGIVVLKRLADALEQGDTIRAVIRGSAVNNDGSGKAGYTAPSVAGQAEVITAALAAGGIDPATVSYVETHGTGTVLGDPIEVDALTRAFLRGGPRERSCALGSVKSNLGHLNAAAGVTGLIKTVLALQHGVLPPSRDFSRPNPRIDFAAVPFHVQTETAGWERGATPRRAGVSSFGIGGTNAHAVLEEAPAAEPSGPSRPWQVLLLSARTPEALEAATDNLAAHLEADPGQSLPGLPDVAYTLRAGRRPFAHRRTVVAASREEAVAALRSRDPRRAWTASQEPGRRSVAFLLPGVGDQYPGIARGLYHEEPVFRQEIDRCADLLLPHLGLDLREALLLIGDEGDEGESRGLRALLGREPAARTLLQETHVAQPAMFAVGYALSQLWMSWNVQPAALLGYSLGEYTAACLAGVMELPDALALVARRARLIGDLAPGAMLAVPLSEEETRARLGGPLGWDLSLAAVNAPAVSVAAGPPEAIAGLERRLAEEGLPGRRLQAAQAFHSWMMQPAAEALRELVRSISLSPPRIPWLSNVTGTWIEPAQATDPDYWVSHLLSTVRFAGGIAELWREPGRILLEMGPGQTLGSLALQQIPEGGADRAVLSSLRHPFDRQPDQRFLLHSLGRLWLAGAEVDWSGFHGGERRRRVPLPAYPFERQRYWVETGIETGIRPGKAVLDGAGWFHAPSWKRDPRPRSSAPVDPAGRWLVLLDPLGLGNLLAQRLTAAGCAVAAVRAPQMGEAGDFDALLSGLGWPPDRILYLWSLGAPDEPARGGWDLTALARALPRREGQGPAEICVITDGLCDVERKDPLHLGKAALPGLLRVIPREHPGISCRLIDVDAGEIGPKLEARLLADLTERIAEPVVAWRGPYRWLPVFEPVPLAPAVGRHQVAGTYLMIGGAGSDLAGPLEDAGAVVSVLAAEEMNETALDRAAAAARRGDPPGFLVLFSALDALTAGAGAGAGAGAIVGAFARERSARGEMPVTAIHWGRGLTVEERLDALRRILESGLPEVMVSPGGSPGDLATALRASAAPAEAAVAPGRKRHPRPALQTPWAAAATATEETVAVLWGELLGIEPIGAHDNFFELGGHSLLGLQAVSRIQARLGVELSLRTLFEAPTVAALAAEVDACRLRGETAAAAIAAVPRDGRPLPLSFAQQRLWFIDQLEPGSPLYNLPAVLRAEGPLRPAVLALCLGEVVRRHEALRTVFALAEGVPVQVIQPAAPFLLPVVDLSGLPNRTDRSDPSDPSDLKARLARLLVGEEAGRPFDLGAHRGNPMLRGVLLRLAEEDHVAALTMHHIASDGWSIGILIREVTVLYEALAEDTADRPSPLPELPVQYADFSAWQSSWLRGEVLENGISFWRRQLAGLPPLLELPTDRPRPAVQSYRGASRPVRLPAALTRQAEALGRHEGATFFMVLLAAFQALLARYSGQDDLATGSPIAGRNRVETEELIGFFVNTLVLRGDLNGEPAFRELLGRTRETALSAYLHQDLPFEKLVEELAPERSLAQTPLFQVMLVLQNAPMGSLEVRDLRLRLLTTEVTTSKLDLTVNVTERDGALDGEIEYATDLFDAATVDRLAGHFEHLLAAAVEAPERRTAELPLLSAAERGQILLEWNDTGPATAPHLLPEAGAPELFAAQARRTPDAVAVVCGHDHQKAALTYAELAGRAGRLARHLRRLGVGPDVLVGLFVERSLDMAVGVLGILQAGGAYVPLDPGYPEQRLAFMLGDTRAPVVVTQEPLRGRLPAGGGFTAVLLDGGEVTVTEGAVIAGGAEPAAENLAYVIYTSGSTGRPKGVALSHGALRNLVDWHLDTLLGGVRTLQIASVSFDVSFYEMFVCWGSGGTLVVVPEELRRDMPALAGLLVEQRVEKAVFPVAVFAQLAEIFAGRAELPPLREITTTGERLQTNQAMAALLDRLPGCVFHNQYGPTETHVATAFTLPSGPGDWPVFPAIGRPIWGSTACALEPGLEPAPIGVPGDLHLGGACVARGYLGRPALTAERFVPDPFSAEPGGRLYRTGDKVRLAVSGELEYLGRFDHQVKIRGFRIEPGEIEEALLALPGVREAVVLAREEGSAGERRLVAYVVGTAVAEELRSALRERLPDYMVPAAFVTLAAFPLTPNRKVDRKALPAPEWQSAGEGHVAPRTPVEEVLAGIWAELLGLERVGADGSFFELGGHSLLATQVMSRLRGAFGVEMPLRDLFEAPTPAGLAVRVELARRAAAPASPLVPLVPALRQGPLPLSFAQQRLWLIDQLAPGSPMYHMPLVLRVEGPLDSAVLERSLSAIVRRHEALRTVFAVRDGAPVQVIRPAVPFVLPVVDLSGLPESRREALALLLARQEALRPFDLARNPLLRGVLLRLADSGEMPDHVAALTMHHIASDGWSLGILVREVTTLYAALAAGRPSPLPELPVQYADFAVWQGSWLRGELLENGIAFWRRQLAGLPPHLDLPTDRPRSTLRSLRGTSRPVRLPAGIARPAEALARREGATLFMVLLASFQALLARLSGQDDLAVGSPIAGRNRVETEGLIGFFVNTLVLRGDLSGAPTFRELLGRTRETALAAYLHQDVPFEKLVEELVPERSLAQTPLFQVMLVLQNVPVESLEIESLRLRPVDVETAVAKFDLTLNLAEHGGALAGSVEYSTALFDAATIGRLTGCFERLLAAALAAPELPALELALLSAAEQHQLLREWSDTAAVFPREATLHGLFAEQAALSPDAVAVEQGGESLTYGELRRRARRIAQRLVARGLRPEERVAVLGERSPDLIAALLGILQAGGAYLPLDPASPAERLHWMLRDAGATLLADMLEGEEPAAPSLPTVPAESLACVMYTSGSTGTPKGVAVTHRNVIRLVRGGGYADLGPEQTWLQYAPVSFDASTLEIWAPLLNGGRLVLFPGRTGPLDDLARVVETHGVTSAWLTAGLFHEMVDGCLAGLRPLSQLLAGGDVVSPVHARRVLEAHPGLTLIDGYGPTEGTTFTCCHRMTEARQVGGEGIPIGRPIANAQVRVLDERLAPVPIGAWGELYAGGDGLARGYLGRPDLTAARFIPDAFVPDAFGEAGGRLYRTGDRVRHRADGLLEFSGRLDGQVKIRGFRIEPGEIEAVLVAHPGVREAVVVARRDRDREIRLVAYVAGEVAAEELRRHLRERLPEPMVPAAFVVLAALPLTANGKVDRKALPAPAEAAGELQASHVPPRTDLEERIARIWCEVLGVERVGVHDGFFDLGGHSLLLLRVVSRLREVLGRDLPNVLLFEHPTVASLAAVLSGSPNLPAAPAPALEHSRDRAAARRESLRRLQRRGKRNA